MIVVRFGVGPAAIPAIKLFCAPKRSNTQQK